MMHRRGKWGKTSSNLFDIFLFCVVLFCLFLLKMDVSIIHDRDCTRPHYTVGQELAEKERRSTKMKSNVKRERERERKRKKSPNSSSIRLWTCWCLFWFESIIQLYFQIAFIRIDVNLNELNSFWVAHYICLIAVL